MKSSSTRLRHKIICVWDTHVPGKQDHQQGIRQKWETRHVRPKLRANGYQEWIFQTKPKKKERKKKTKKTNTNSAKTRTPSNDLPYVRVLSDKLTPIFQQHGIGGFHKPFHIIELCLCTPNDKTKSHQNAAWYTRYSAWTVMKHTVGKQEEHSTAGWGNTQTTCLCGRTHK